MKIRFREPVDLVLGRALRQKNVPCHCLVGKEFRISFNPIKDLVVKVEDWSIDLFNSRFPARGGGQHLYSFPSMITLEKKYDLEFEIVYFQVFYERSGWVSLIEKH